MATHQNDVVLRTQSHAFSVDSLEELDALEDDDPLSSAATTTVAVPITSVPPSSDDSRRLFQRLWTDEDEIELLQGFLDFTTQRSLNGAAHPHHDTAGFYDIIKHKLQFEFNKSQLVEKLRRLKKKYRNVLAKIGSSSDFAFKCAHDQTTFELSKKIWGETVGSGWVKCEENFDDDDNNSPNVNVTPNGGTAGCEEKAGKSKKRVRSGSESDVERVVEETVKRCVSPMVKEFVNGMIGGFGSNGLGTSPQIGISSGLSGIMMNPGLLNFGLGVREGSVDERWRKQQILELEVYSKRLELVQEHVKAALDELRATQGDA